MFSIAPYFVELLDEQQQPIDLWDISSGLNLKGVLVDYYTLELKTYTQITSHRLFRVAALYNGSDISVSGQYETGEHGFKSNLYDVKQKSISHEKEATEADMLPFLFTFVFPKSNLPSGRKKGLLLLSRTKALGIRTITIPHLKRYVESRFYGFTLNVSRIIPAALARDILQRGTIKSIRLVKYRLPSTLEDLLDQDDRSQVQDIEIVIKAKRNGGFNIKDRLLDLLSGKGEFRQLYSSPDLACDNVKLDVELSGKIRRINIGKRRVSSNIEITEDVEVDSTGYPTVESWFAVADNLAESLASELGIQLSLETDTGLAA